MIDINKRLVIPNRKIGKNTGGFTKLPIITKMARSVAAAGKK